MSDVTWWYDQITASLWFLLACAGVFRRCRRMIRLRRIKLVEPVDPRDAAYLRSVRRSTYLRLGVKIVFLVGALIVLFDLTVLWAVWRLGVVVSLLLMYIETVSVDNIRERLGRSTAEAG